VNQNQISTKDLSPNSQENGVTKNVKAVTRSLLNILSQVKNLNLSFKSGSQKISIKIVPIEQNVDSSGGIITKNIIETNSSVLNSDDLISNINEYNPTDKSSDTHTVNSATKNSNKTNSDLQIDDSKTCSFNVEITHISSTADNSILNSSNDSFTGSLIKGNNSMIKFFEDYSSISSKQNNDNLFVQDSKSTSINYSNQEISGNLTSGQDLIQKNSSTAYTSQTSENSSSYSNNIPFTKMVGQQILNEDKSTIIKVLKNSGAISFSDLQDSSCFKENSKTQVNIGNEISSIISPNKNSDITSDMKDNTLTSVIDNCSFPGMLTGKQQSNISSLQTATVSDLILKTQTEVSSMNSVNDTTNKSSLQKQTTDDSTNQIQQDISNINQTPDKSAISQYSGKIELENISMSPSTPEEVIKNLFNNRKVESNKNINTQITTKDAVEQLKNIAGLSQSMRKISLIDSSNSDQNSSDNSIKEVISNNVSTSNQTNDQKTVDHSIENTMELLKSNDINQINNNDIDQSLSIKDNSSIKSNNIFVASKSSNTDLIEKNTAQLDFGVKELKNQTDTTSGKTSVIEQMKSQDMQKEVQRRSETIISDKNTSIDQIKNQDPQNITAFIATEGNKSLNLPSDSDAKTTKEAKNNSKVGIITKDDGSSNSTVEKTQGTDTQAKNQDDKDFLKQKFTEAVKINTVQNSTNANDFETGKLKVLTDFKTVNETVKTISVSEVIPEFSKAIQQNEKQSLTFQLTPDNLGKVKLVVDIVQNQVNTRIVVENNQIKQFIQSNVEQLKQSLNSSGIDLNSVNISLAGHEQKSNKSIPQRKKINGKLESINPTDSQQASAKKIMGYNTYEYLV